MTVILVLVTFIALVVTDYVYSRRHAIVSLQAAAPAEPAAPLRPAFAAGFEVRDHLKYHPGHTWALRESANLVRVGIDDFAARLIGKVDRITLPRRGQWIRQGQKIWSVERDGKKVDMASPIEGIVTEIHEAAAAAPDEARRHPYDDGWLVKVESPDASTNLRNLIAGNVAKSWMEEAASRLRLRLPAVAGAVAQDGGVAIDDVPSILSGDSWLDLAREFFLI
ncbi:MAG: glycine cleavage system protein H [Acidobacteria bacterium]|nr:glycine cleavage system protein H [Acidobacteriota bacterium]